MVRYPTGRDNSSSGLSPTRSQLGPYWLPGRFVSGDFLFLGIGFAIVNQWSEHGGSLVPKLLLASPHRHRVDGGFPPLQAAHLPEQMGIGFALQKTSVRQYQLEVKHG